MYNITIIDRQEFVFVFSAYNNALSVAIQRFKLLQFVASQKVPAVLHGIYWPLLQQVGDEMRLCTFVHLTLAELFLQNGLPYLNAF